MEEFKRSLAFNQFGNNSQQIQEQNNHYYEPILPIETFKYFNYRDKYLWGHYIAFLMLALVNLFTNIEVIILISSLFICILLFVRYLAIQETTNVYNDFFSYNGILIPFQLVKSVKIIGNGLHITYNEEKLQSVPELEFEKLPKIIAFTHNHELLKFETIYNKSKAKQILSNQN